MQAHVETAEKLADVTIFPHQPNAYHLGLDVREHHAEIVGGFRHIQQSCGSGFHRELTMIKRIPFFWLADPMVRMRE